MSKHCTNCDKRISEQEMSISYNPSYFIFCQRCSEAFMVPLYALRDAGTPEEIVDELNKQKPILLHKGMSDEAFSYVMEYFLDVARQIPISAHTVTSGYNFEGYQIEEYLGIMSGHVVLGTGFLSEVTAGLADFFGVESDLFAEKMEKAKDAALQKLIKKSIEKGGNALIGVDFDYLNTKANMIGVSANGTSVVIKKVAGRTNP